MTQKNIPPIENHSHKPASKPRDAALLSESRRLLNKKCFPVQLDTVRQTTIPVPIAVAKTRQVSTDSAMIALRQPLQPSNKAKTVGATL